MAGAETIERLRQFLLSYRPSTVTLLIGELGRSLPRR